MQLQSETSVDPKQIYLPISAPLQVKRRSFDVCRKRDVHLAHESKEGRCLRAVRTQLECGAARQEAVYEAGAGRRCSGMGTGSALWQLTEFG